MNSLQHLSILSIYISIYLPNMDEHEPETNNWNGKKKERKQFRIMRNELGLESNIERKIKIQKRMIEKDGMVHMHASSLA